MMLEAKLDNIIKYLGHSILYVYEYEYMNTNLFLQIHVFIQLFRYKDNSISTIDA